MGQRSRCTELHAGEFGPAAKANPWLRRTPPSASRSSSRHSKGKNASPRRKNPAVAATRPVTTLAAHTRTSGAQLGDIYTAQTEIAPSLQQLQKHSRHCADTTQVGSKRQTRANAIAHEPLVGATAGEAEKPPGAGGQQRTATPTAHRGAKNVGRHEAGKAERQTGPIKNLIKAET